MLKCVLIVIVVEMCVCDNMSKLAADHFARMMKVAKCDKPVPRVVYLSKLFPKVNKKYIPFATVVSVCDSSTGCCSDESHRCVPKTIKPITLHFLALELTAEGNKKSVEPINFENHTQCQCKHINSDQTMQILEDYSTERSVSLISSSNHLELLEDMNLSNSAKVISSNKPYIKPLTALLLLLPLFKLFVVY